MKFNLNPFVEGDFGNFSSKFDLFKRSKPFVDKELHIPYLKQHLSKSLMRVNLVALLLGMGLSQVTANTYGQQVTLKREKANLETVLKDLEKQSGFKFFYKNTDINGIKNISINVKNAPFEQTLKSILNERDFSYEYFDKTIVLKKELEKSKTTLSKKTLSNTELSATNVVIQQQIQGRVVDEKGKPLVGVSIVVKSNTKVAVSTDDKGFFSLPVSADNQEAVFSFLGYKAQTIKLSKSHGNYQIVLNPDLGELDEVVVSTGIFNRKSATYTGAAVTVTADELKMFGNRSILSSLRNIDPSFNILESNSFGSDPNRMPEIQIRGNSSIPNVTQLQDETRVGMNTPLIILDGFESTLQRLVDLNENEVESITILKDASATAIYGSRGANGVVVIQTKAPKEGKMRISYRGDINVEAPDLSAYDLLDAKDKLDLEWKVGLYNYGRIQTDIPLKRYYNFLVNEITQGVNTDWMALPLRTGVGQRHNIKIEGGDSKFRYSASVQNNNVQGVMKGSFKNTLNGTINLSYIHNDVKFSNQLIVGLGKTEESPYGSFSDYSRLNAYWRPYDEEGNVNKFLGDPGNLDYVSRWSTLPTNPLYNATLNGFNKTNSTTITNNLAVELKVMNDFNIRTRLGLTKSNNQSDRYRSPENTAFAYYSMADVFRKGDYTYGISNGFSYDGGVNVSYFKNFAEKHSVFAGVDYNIRQADASDYSFRAEGFTNPKFDFISMALQYPEGGKPSGSESLSRSVGMTANVNYTYDNKYYIDGSFRRDGSSQFGSNNRFAPFWSTGLGWNIHNEGFMQNVSFVNRLKLRGSMGITGSQNFDTYQALSTYRYYTADRYYDKMGAYLLGLGNENLKWQQKMNYNVGLESQMFDKRLSLTVDYYEETTKDLVSSLNLSPSNGFSTYIENTGSLRNKGFEAKATAFLYQNRENGISWSVTAAGFRNINKIVNVSQALKDAGDAIIKAGGSVPTSLYFEGYSSNTIWAVPSLGIDPSNGKELYLKKDGTATYSWNSADVTAVGITDPKIQGTLSTMLRVKGFTANLVFGYRTGGQLYNNTLIDKVENTDYRYNVDSRVYYDRWQQPGDIAMFKGLDITSATQMSSRFVQNEKTLTCQSINLMYDLQSKSLKRKLGVEAITISSSMEDLFYMSTVKRERGTTYPFSRKGSLTLNLMF